MRALAGATRDAREADAGRDVELAPRVEIIHPTPEVEPGALHQLIGDALHEDLPAVGVPGELQIDAARARLAEQIGVTDVAGVLVMQIDQYPPKVGRLAVVHDELRQPVETGAGAGTFDIVPLDGGTNGDRGMWARAAVDAGLISRRQMAGIIRRNLEFRLRGSTDDTTDEVRAQISRIVAGQRVVDLRRMMPEVLAGVLPRTASDGQDPADSISPQGQYSQDVNFASCQGILPLPPIPVTLIEHLRAAHTGASSAILNGCSGRALGDNRARGYITVDAVNSCTLLFPSDPGYFGPGGVASSANVLFGDYFIVDSPQNAARGDELVRIEAFPGRFHPNESTFYGRFRYGGSTNYQAVDDREPLATTWATRFLEGGVFDAGVSFVVWRDPRVPTAAFPCNSVPPLQGLESFIAFDEEENAELPTPCNILCPPDATPILFPAVSQRVSGLDQISSFAFGWLGIQFGPQTPSAPARQAWMGVELEASGRFSVGLVASPLDSACGAPARLPGY